jgi:hypothetical protein
LKQGNPWILTIPRIGREHHGGKHGIEMGGKHEQMNAKNKNNSREKHKQIMRNKPIRFKNILNLRLVTLCD